MWRILWLGSPFEDQILAGKLLKQTMMVWENLDLQNVSTMSCKSLFLLLFMVLCIWLVLLRETSSLGRQHPWGNIIPRDRYTSSLGEKYSLPNGTMAMGKCHP